MNEQEYMHYIKKQAENVPIPDSISPENMKKMLDEQASSSITDTKNNSKPKTFQTRKWISTAIAACAAICIFGGVGFSIFGKQSSDKGLNNVTYDTAVEEEAAEAIEEEAAGTPVEDSSNSTLAYQTTMKNPASYDEYYDTIKAVYDDYYDSFAEVDMETGGVVGAEEKESYEASREFSEDLADDTLSLENSASKANDFSTTNTQEENVDEADIVKTDGNYIYKANGSWKEGVYTGTLTITKAENGKLTKEGSIDLTKCISESSNDYVYFREFYLYNNYLILLFENFTDETKTTTVIYDISDKSNPVQKKTFIQSGSYQGSRISDGFLYTISDFVNMDFSTKEQYSNYIPSINDALIDCKNIYYPDNALLESTFVITALDINSLTVTDSKAVPTNGGGLYVSEQSIYIYGTIYTETTQTEILRIAYDKGTLTVGKSAVLSGYLYDSFALNEYNNHLRVVATIPANNIALLRNTNDIAPIAEESDKQEETLKEDINVLYIFDETMTLTSKIAGIAPGEQIQSARFLGNIGYLVTFENVDPLFSIDLSDPYNPEIIGRLSIPGFSEYLHHYDEGLLLGIGQEITPDTQEFVGLKLSMFDISNPEDVKVANQQIMKDGYYSPAEHNHRALMIDTDKNLFGFFYQEQIEGVDYNYVTNNYYVTYTYDSKNGFIETGRYKVDMESYDTDSIRGLYIGNYLYVTTSDSITSYELNSDKQIDYLNQ